MACKPAQKIVKSMNIDEITRELRLANATPQYTEEQLNELGSKALRKFMELSGQSKKNESDTDGDK